MKDHFESQDNQNLQNTISRGPLDSINTTVVYHNQINLKETENEMMKWRASSKLKGAIFYFFLGLYLLLVGIVFSVKNDQLTEIKNDYYQTCKTLSQKCEFSIFFTGAVSGPVYLFIEIRNSIMNTQDYMNSYNPSQIYTNLENGTENDCSPFKTNGEININQGKPLKNFNQEAVLNDSDLAIPCGARFYDHFTDTFSIKKKGSTSELTISTKNIAWKYDRDHIKNVDISKQWLDLEDEVLQNWQRPAGLSKFRKTIGRIDQDLEAGEYIVTTNNVYDTDKFSTLKTLVLSNLNSAGGKNSPMVATHLAGGSVCLLGSIGLALWHFRKRLPS